MSLLDAPPLREALRSLDMALARSLRRLQPDTDDAVLAAAALASLAVAHGHAGFAPEAPGVLVEGSVPWPEPDDWQARLAASRWVDCPAAGQPARVDAPLVLEHGLLYLRRYREYERALAADLARIAADRAATGGADGGAVPVASAALLDVLFPPAGHDPDQRTAALTALDNGLTLISGGPGAGKTTTIARVLLLMLADAADRGAATPRIALAAPTGRAADRMAASLRKARQQLQDVPGIDAALLDALPTQASTLHRLLGTLPDSVRFRHHRERPLPFDVVVVDEASMIDLPLMAKLAEAVAEGTRLLLLGDPDQLPSVEAGDVLAAMIDAAERTRALPHARLRGAWRQQAGLTLAPLSEAVRSGDADAARALLHGGTLAGVHVHRGQHDPLHPSLHADLLQPWHDLLAIDDPLEALAAIDNQRLLTVLRDGPQGANTLNARIEDALAGKRRATYFHGRLLMVTENSYRHGLFNGDTGVCLLDADGVAEVWFPGEGGQPRRFLPAHLPAHASAWAITVHKAQGSEFERVWLQLPTRPVRVLTRELVYTAITRARRELHLLGSDAVLSDALGRRVQRISGLGRRLHGESR